MKHFNTLAFFVLLMWSANSWSQIKKNLPAHVQQNNTSPIDVEKLQKPKALNIEESSMRKLETSFSISDIQTSNFTDVYYSIKEKDHLNRPIWVEGFLAKSSDLSKAPMDIKAIHLMAKIFPQEVEGFNLTEQHNDDLNIYHARFQQHIQSVPVYGADMRMHIYSDGKFIFNGRTYTKTENVESTPTLSVASVINNIQNDLNKSKEIVIPTEEWSGEDYGNQFSEELVWWPFEEDGSLKLCYHVKAQANYLKLWNYFVCAHTGDIIYKFNINGFVPNYIKHRASLKNNNSTLHTENNFSASANMMDGPRTANARDMDNKTVPINTYQLGNDFYMIDASQSMYVNNSIQQGSPKGVTNVLSANNTTPYNNSLRLFYVSSTNNTWTDPITVSAHHHTTLSYSYLKNRLNRTSLDNRNLNMETIVHYTDDNGKAEENAFWHPGRNQIFLGGAPGGQVLIRNAAAALDVVGHEYGHGVIEYTAKLIYRNQSGAVNETYADIFGAMIEGRNWQLGEDIINRNNFRTGALRDMSNPRNGGNSLNDYGYQPDNVSTMYRGSEDNGGVHINSGIGNFAYYKVATRTSKDIALDIFYRALTTYLTASSEFIDFRKACIRSAIDLHGEGQIPNVVRQAFNEVGIIDGQENNPEEDIDTNPGLDYVVLSDENLSQLYLADGEGNIITNPFSTTAPISKLSFTDNGQFGLFVGDDNKVYLISINYGDGTYQEIVLLDDPDYRNVAISKDGTLLAVLLKELDNKIYVYSFERERWQAFTLYNYFTGPNSPKVENVLFADVLEFAYDGEYIMYDAKNDYGEGVQPWDISFMQVWDKNSENFAEGNISKLFNSLDTDFSIGNPTFSKNSPYIIAFDFINDVSEEYIIYGLNLERQELGVIFENSTLGYPSYSRDDSQLIFDAEKQSGGGVLARVDLNTDKITSDDRGRIFIDGGSWGTWFSNGSRVLSSTDNEVVSTLFSLSPNPATDILTVQGLTHKKIKSAQIEIFNAQGNVMILKDISQQDNLEIRVSDWPKGLYFIHMTLNGEKQVKKFVKID